MRIRSWLPAAIAVVTVAGMPAPLAFAEPATPSNSEAPFAVEDGAYPFGPDIKAATGAELIAGDGNITYAPCSAGNYQVVVWARNLLTNESRICFKAANTGYLKVNIPRAYRIETYDRDIKASISIEGSTENLAVPKNTTKAFGDADPAAPKQAVLVEMRVTGSGTPAPQPPADGNPLAFTGKLAIGDTRSCTAALIDPLWVVTAKSCFADKPAENINIPAGAPKNKTVLTLGRANLASTGGHTSDITELVPHADRDLVLARLAAPATGITPVALSTAAPVAGQELTLAGYGRTSTEWAPSKLHSAAYTTGTATAAAFDITAKAPTDAPLCKGDAGAPALRTEKGKPALAAVTSRSWQNGCLGTLATDKSGAYTSRTDDLVGWMQQITSRDLLPRSKWANADLMASGYFTGGSANGTRHMDLVVRWTDGSVSLFQGADHNDPKYPFAAEHKVAAPNSVWRYARALTAGSFAATGTDGLVVRWSDGELTEFAHVDAAGFHDEKTHRPANTVAWQSAKLITAGRYTANPLRDDLLVVWNDGKVSLYADIDTNGVTKESVLSKANTTWPHAEQISAGAFTGKATNDLMVRWSDGETTIYPGVDTAGFHGEIKIRDPKSPWLNAKVLTVGAFVGNKSAQDVLVRWTDGKLSLFPAVDAAGLHTEVKLVG
ncbi:trypsin-like serine protease [Streptomyces sp. NPDC002602]|uniref:trypsin-like serine protease n=1 Tax=Streptomyces sp. NPDC002602 TaxID=3364654 RepID=UPI003681653E